MIVTVNWKCYNIVLNYQKPLTLDSIIVIKLQKINILFSFQLHRTVIVNAQFIIN